MPACAETCSDLVVYDDGLKQEVAEGNPTQGDHPWLKMIGDKSPAEGRTMTGYFSSLASLPLGSRRGVCGNGGRERCR